jgi:hypothetical protein
VAASAQPVAPRPLGLLADHCAPLEIATDPILLGRAAPFGTSRPILLVPWRMAVCTTPCPDRLHTPALPFPARLALDDPVSPACLGPRVGKAEQGNGPRAPCRWVATWRPLDRQHRRLVGMHGQPAPVKPLRQDRHHPARVGFHRAAEAESSGHARQTAAALQPGGTSLTHHASRP